jgi:TonB-dependent receptor
MRFQYSFLFLLILFCSISSYNVYAQSKTSGEIAGHLVDSQSGDPLIGANVYLENTTMGAASDLVGNYVIPNVPPGKYTLVILNIGYAETKVTNVEVIANETTKLDLAVDPEIMTSETIVVEAKVLENTDASLLKSRQKSNSVSDAISAETISRIASADAADAMRVVTGASVVSGKYIYIRGLGDRYSNTQLNGAELPSADPDKKAFNMDIVPSKLLDNIVTKKSFTPDEPGSFSGGLVNIGTKAFPDAFYIEVSTGIVYNTQSSGNNNFLTYSGSRTDWIGFDDGLRDIPQILRDPDVFIPTRVRASTNFDQGLLLDEQSKAFNTEWAPHAGTGPINQNFSFSIGNTINVLGNPFGFYGSLTYQNRASFYENGTVGRWQLSGIVQEANGLKEEKLYQDYRSNEEALIGAMGTVSYQITKNHEFTFDIMSTQSGIKTSRYMWGEWPDQLTGGETYETRSLEYTERNLNTYQLKGKHHLDFLADMNIEWIGSLGKTKQNEPDLRFFSNTFRNDVVDNRDTTYYTIDNNLYNYPTRFWRSLEEDKNNVKIDISFPFTQWDQLSSRFKFGGFYTDSDRSFQQRHFEFRQQDAVYNGNPVEFFNNVGISDSSNINRLRFGNFVQEVPSAANNYNGYEKITALYAMVEIPLTQRLRFVGGVRYETTWMNIVNLDKTVATLENKDWLPAASVIFQVGKDMNLRLAYGKTLARPTLRELSPLRTFEFLGDDLYGGNPLLKRTLINNMDLRWEWFDRPGEIYAISGFYKTFKNPIERYYDIGSEKYSHQNVPDGRVYGVELEVRKGLDVISPVLKNFSINANLSLIHSEVTIPEQELDLIRRFDNSPEETRPLYGQSPYIVNLEFVYSNIESGTSASLLYNVLGKRLYEVVVGATPDVYEQPKPLIDIMLSQYLSSNLKLRAGVKNLLNSWVSRVQTFNGHEYNYNRFTEGRTFSIGLNFSI